MRHPISSPDAALGRATVASVLLEQARRRGEADFLLFDREPGDPGAVEHVSWSCAADRAARAAVTLRRLGVRRGQPFGVHLANCPEFYDAWFAAALLGAVMVPTNPLSTADELAYVYEHSGCRVVLTSDDLLPVVRKAGADTVVAVGRGWLDAVDPTDAEPARYLDPTEALGVLYTSGTTSRPKGVVVSHAAYLHCGEAVAGHLRLRPDDRQLVVLPLFHGNAQYYSSMSALVTGASIALAPRFSASGWSRQATELRATVASLFAAPIRMSLAKAESEWDRAHALRVAVYAQNVTDAQVNAFEARFGVPLRQLYGMTETVAPPVMTPLYAGPRAQSMGRPTLDARVRLVDSDGRDVSPGDIGEVLVGGEPGRTLMTEYLGDPEATARTLRSGWLHTGDMARADDDGYLRFVDRAKDVIKRAGENVSSGEVERVLDEHADVVESAAVAVPDEMRDEALVAFVVRSAGSQLDEGALLAHVAQRLARFKVPDRVVFVDGLPRTSVGKIQKHLLEEPASAGRTK